MSIEKLDDAILRFATASGNIWIGKTRKGLVFAPSKEQLPEQPDPTMEALKNEVAAKYAEVHKSPMLVVGAHTYMRANLPAFMLTAFDVHLFFFPNSYAAWVCGAVATDRVRQDAKPIWAYGASQNIEVAVKGALWELVGKAHDQEVEAHAPKWNEWFQNWIYRCPKISLKDVLHLEPYPAEGLAEYKPAKRKKAIQLYLRVIEGKGE